ncbi:MAG: hypothetical protein UU48_C0001G0145 [Candidatus Uhrbacteria bacterium GW2011_GWF2_41_16]|uniref:Uncharacterized protein n=2 Tax=Candidatus Uhriibacteriota TaxID=1752732 RepID=A0A0G0XPP9_9BACT|nr:MAG: hypothetical protein UU31_C0002G0041 [Candidatus Uhrbacteria bacterium GW2011_GWA2_41_10]KKR87851.1 MAG: hypothetical protein UU35_C0001G0132 [Candidatus Uhrbacteria bacterium GW2011_GWC2_41_11]KKR98790.1 MAG: hypothetical protein UU48_C0001G0145 [Candidatus Uhrbacteria bacterium GW2011_GWF2_41_16]
MILSRKVDLQRNPKVYWFSMIPTVSINIVAWNSMDRLPTLLESIFSQTFQNFVVRIVDNGSTDHVGEFLREKYPQVMLIRNTRNLGFSCAHNQGIRYAIDKWTDQSLDACFVLVVNPDVVFTPTFLEDLLRNTENNPKVASFGGKLLRAFPNPESDDAWRDMIRSSMIDSTGLRPNRRRCVAERGAGEEDTGQYDKETDIFGVSGALVLYRASALEDIRFEEDEYFDHDFFAYQEDIDLAWRLRSCGWSARFVPRALAYHERAMSGNERVTLWQLMKNRQRKSRLRSYYSTRNHWVMLFKNMSWSDWVLSLPWVIPMEAARFVYVCVFESMNIGAFAEVVLWMPHMWHKRRQIMKKRNESKTLRAWFQ